MFFAAPMPTGIEIAMPITVETTVIQRLSRMPSAISLQRLAKSGGKKAAKKRAPRGRPPQTRGPVHLGSAQRQRQVGGGAETDRPAQPRALDQGWFLPAARRDRDDAHVNPAMRSRCGWRLSSEITLLVSCGSSASSSTLRIVADQSSSP